ncbi:MAG: efflux RND transporter periplasmic adaptor subunit [Magnetococcales bacterium]|nr:efflux RND transporter periplasmic adaptor subunit [Magnetococcales bacterium]
MSNRKETSRRACATGTLMMLLVSPLFPAGAISAENGAGEASINLRGVVLPVHQSKLGFTQSGVVIQLPMEGAMVKKGALLAGINDSVAQQQVAKARASLAGAQLKLAQATNTQEKNQRLHAEKILSDMALKEGEYGITQGKIGMDQANAEMASARLALEGTKLFAPFDGVVSRVTAHLGEWIGAGAPALELVDMNHLEVSMDVPPDSLTGLEAGLETGVFIDGKRAGTARARTILPLVDAASGLRRVIWSVTPDAGAVMTGRYVTLGGWRARDEGGKP